MVDEKLARQSVSGTLEDIKERKDRGGTYIANG